MDWPTAMTEVSKIVFPSLFTFFGSYLAIRSQLKTKSMDIESQTSLKAKELIFSTYQKRLEKEEKEAAELIELSHSFFDKKMRGDMEGVTLILTQLLSRQVYGLNQEEFEYLISVLKEAGIADRHKRKIEIIQSRMAVDPKAIGERLKILPKEQREMESSNYAHGLAISLSLMSTLRGHSLRWLKPPTK